MLGSLGHMAASQSPLVMEEAPPATPGKLEEPDHSSSNWYFSREEIEKNSPSRKDGIDVRKETYFRKSYCTFLQDLGMRLKVPQVTIATAIVFCHRFFLRQSHAKNDRHMVATVCMFLAGKVEETPRPLRDVILVSYEIRHKKDPAAVHRIKQKEVYEEQKDLVLVGERLVLTTLGFDLNIHHPYKPLVTAIKKYKVAQHALAQVAWNFVNDGLRTSLCLQFKPHHIAAGAIFLAAKFLKVKLPSDGEKVWWQEFEVTPRQLEEVSNQMLELYEQNKVGPSSRMSEQNGSAGTSVHEKPITGLPAHSDAAAPSERSQLSQGANAAVQSESWLQQTKEKVAAVTTDDHHPLESTTRPISVNGHTSEMTVGCQEENPSSNFDNVSKEEDARAGIDKIDDSISKEEEARPGHNKLCDSMEVKHPSVVKKREELETHNMLSKVEDLQEQTAEEISAIPHDNIGGEDERASEYGAVDKNLQVSAEPDSLNPPVLEGESEAITLNRVVETKIQTEEGMRENKRIYADIDEVNKDKVKAALEKRRKSRGEGRDSKTLASKMDFNEEELLERELESGVEAAAEAERAKHDQSGSRSPNQQHGKQAADYELVKEEENDSGMKFKTGSSEGTTEAGQPKHEDSERKVKTQQESAFDAAAEKLKRDSKTKGKHRGVNDLVDQKKDRLHDLDNSSLKRKRSKDEMLSPSDWKWSKHSERPDWSGDLERTKLKERSEDGEYQNDYDQVHSPRMERRSQQLPGTNKSNSPSRQWENTAHGQHGRRDGAQENKHRHGYNRDHHYHHSHHHQQYRVDDRDRYQEDRDRYHHKERDYQERDQKKPRHSYGK